MKKVIKNNLIIHCNTVRVEDLVDAILTPFVKIKMLGIGENLSVWLNTIYGLSIKSVNLWSISKERKMSSAENLIIFIQDLIGNEFSDIAECQVDVAITPEIIIYQILLEDLSIADLEVGQLVGTLQS